MSKSKHSKQQNTKGSEEPEIQEEQLHDCEFRKEGEWIYTGDCLVKDRVKYRHGVGKLVKLREDNGEIQEIYEGEWVMDSIEGKGEYKYTNNDVYKGHFKNGKHNGYGEYFFTDGSYYKGEWKEHRMHGKGVFVECNGVNWDGFFQEGVFLSSAQAELREVQFTEDRVKSLESKAGVFLEGWTETMSTVDKKTAKELLSPWFCIEESHSDLIEGPFPKFEDKNADKWTAAFQFVYENKPEIKVIRPEGDTLFTDRERIKAEQLTEDLAPGQVIELRTVVNEKTADLGLVFEGNTWLVMHYNETIQKKKK